MDRTGHNTICFDVAQVDGSTYHGYMEFNIPWEGFNIICRWFNIMGGVNIICRWFNTPWEEVNIICMWFNIPWEGVYIICSWFSTK
jgi:hypothetical protein